MKSAKKILVTLFTMILVTVYSGGVTVFASEASQVINDVTQVSSINNTSATTDADLQTNDADSTDTTTSKGNEQDQDNDSNVYVDDQGQVYDNGALVDEQGDVLTPDENGNVTDDTDASEDTDASDVSDNNSSKSSDKDKNDTKDKDTSKDKANEKPAYAEKDLRLLSALIYAEAGHQPYDGQVGVANVVLNRLKSDAYWHVHNIKEVIYDKKWSVQFAVTVKYGKSGMSAMDRALKCYDNDPKTMQKSIKSAKAALEGENNIGSFLCFQNKRYASSIKKKYSNYKIIGDHIFYRAK